MGNLLSHGERGSPYPDKHGFGKSRVLLCLAKVAGEHVHPAHTEIRQCQMGGSSVSTGNPNQRGSFEIVSGLGQVTRCGFEVSKVVVYASDFDI